ncbi:MAG: PqqD family protein [Pyrinomonadaceae bacterium]
MKNLPLARRSGLVLQESGKDLLIYDLQINRAFSLNETAKTVFNACDGKTAIEDLLLQNKDLNEGIIQLAIDGFQREGLLAERPANGLSRRKIMEKAALSAIALPIITGVFAPKVTYAQSCAPVGTNCASAATCCPGLDCTTRCCVPLNGPCNLNNPGACCTQACLSTSGGLAGTCF